MRIRNLEDYQVFRQIAFTGDCTFRIECDQNDGYARIGKTLCADFLQNRHLGCPSERKT